MAKIDEDNFVPWEIASELRALGYDKYAFGGFSGGDRSDFLYHPDSDITLDVPLFQEAFDWFEDKHGLFLNRRLMFSSNEILDARYYITSINGTYEVVFTNSYNEFDRKEAKIASLYKLISLVKNGINKK